MAVDLVFLVIAALPAGTSLVVFLIVSQLLYARLRRSDERPPFAMLSVPGYLVRYCGRIPPHLKEQFKSLIEAVRVCQYVLVATWCVLLILLFCCSRRRGGCPERLRA